MSKIKQLASQTVWYGASSIISRLLNFLLTPFLTRVLHTPKGISDYSDMSLLYACITVLNVLYTYGFETAYFRFSNKEGVSKQTLLRTAFGSLVVSTIGLSLFFILLRYPLSRLVEQAAHPENITITILIISFDTLCAIPLARLRQENRPKRYAFVNLSGVLVNILLTYFFVSYCAQYALNHPNTWLANFYNNHSVVTLILLANLAKSIFAFFLLFPQWRDVRIQISTKLWKELFAYSSPMIITGLGGMINETMDRFMLLKWVPGTVEQAKHVQGIYSANYKLAIVITLFIQAFKMAAEPFFFNQSSDKDAPKLYARIMKWFVIVVCLAFLTTVLYIDFWQLIEGPKYRSGLGVVPILLLANVFLGIYYNQAVWYKLSNMMRAGMYITLIGAVITIVINYLFIPKYGMYASAWATCICYGSMMVISYFWGHQYYPIPYNVKKILAYIVSMLLLFFVQKGLMALTSSVILHFVTGTILMGAFLLLIIFAEKKELKSFPIIGKYFSKI